MSLPRFHVPEAAPGARVTLPEHTAHHAREVLRLRSGASVRVFDGAGHEWDAVLDEVTRRTASARLLHAVEPRPESPLQLCLAMAVLKGDRMELVIQKATELGVAAIWPVVTDRTDAAARPALQGSRSERWERVASGAAEQCGRATVPHVAPTVTLAALVERPWDGPARRSSRPPVTRPCRRSRSTPLCRCCCSSAPPAASSPARLLRSGRPASCPPRWAHGSFARKRRLWPQCRSPRPRGATSEPAPQVPSLADERSSPEVLDHHQV